MLLRKDLSNYGVTISIGSGVVSIQGFLTAFVGEVFKVASGPTQYSYGMVVNLCRDETMNLVIGSLMFNPDDRLFEGAKVTSLTRLASILLGDYVIGSILDPLGNLLLNTGGVKAQYRWVIESPAPGIIDRQSVFEPLQTGIISIDAMVPIGLGQRELVVGDRQTGKTSIGVDTILNQKTRFCVISLRANWSESSFGSRGILIFSSKRCYLLPIITGCISELISCMSVLLCLYWNGISRVRHASSRDTSILNA
jgi:F-type H+-transporting ATPase subunit alpha